MDGDRTFISSEGIVEQVDFTVYLCSDNDIVLNCAVTANHQIVGAVLHGGCYSTQLRDNMCVWYFWIDKINYIVRNSCETALPICDMELWGPDFIYWQDNFIILVI